MYPHTPHSTDLPLYSLFMESHTVPLTAICIRLLSAHQPAKFYSPTTLSDHPCHLCRARARSSQILKFRSFHTKKFFCPDFKKHGRIPTYGTHRVASQTSTTRRSTRVALKTERAYEFCIMVLTYWRPVFCRKVDFRFSPKN